MNAALAQRLAGLKNARSPLNEWRYVFRGDFDQVRPLLTACPGDFTGTYLLECGQALRVRQLDEKRFVAHTVGRDCGESEDLYLTWADVGLWRLSDTALKQAEEVAAGGRPPALPQDVARAIGDFERIILPSGRVMLLTKKYKRRQFLRLVHKHCTAMKTGIFDWQHLIEDYNSRITNPNDKNKKIVSDRVDDDLFKGQQAEFRELFELEDRYGGRLRLKVRFEFAES